MDRRNIPAELLADVKNYLNITWDDEATDHKIAGLIASGAAYLEDKLGGAANFEEDGMARTLLFDYVRYGRDSALDVFETNYRPLILGEQNKKAVERYGWRVESSL